MIGILDFSVNFSIAFSIFVFISVFICVIIETSMHLFEYLIVCLCDD